MKLRYTVSNKKHLFLFFIVFIVLSYICIKQIENKYSEDFSAKIKHTEVLKENEYIMKLLSVGLVAFILGFIFVILNQRQILKNIIDQKVKEVKEKDQMILHQAKLSAMGEMINNIAHQWRQPINGISLLNASIVQKYYNNKIDDQYIEKYKSQSELLIKTLSTTIEDFKSFLSQDTTKEVFLVSDAIEKTLRINEAQIRKHHLQINTHIKTQIKIINYKTKLEQVLLNLLNNSKDALVQNNIKDKKIDVYCYEDESNIIIQHIDNGGGIDEKNLEKIFEPYFTTKQKDLGTGIGLYMSQLIVQEHLGGTIDIRNFKNGVKAVIFLPKTNGKI